MHEISRTEPVDDLGQRQPVAEPLPLRVREDGLPLEEDGGDVGSGKNQERGPPSTRY